MNIKRTICLLSFALAASVTPYKLPGVLVI